MPVTPLTLQTITSDSPEFPLSLFPCPVFNTSPTLYAIGNLHILQHKAIALFCSVKCPGDLILHTYDLAQALRAAGIPTISGGHSPIEQDCLKILRRGSQSIIYCPARSLHKIRLSQEHKQAIEEDRLLLISPFSSSYARATAELAQKRNEMIGAIAQTVFIAYAAPNSKTLAFAQRLVQAGKSVITFNTPHNSVLQEQGATELNIDALIQQSKYC